MVGDRLIEPTETAQHVAEVHVQRRVPRQHLESATVSLRRQIQLSKVAKRIAEIEVGRRKVGLRASARR